MVIYQVTHVYDVDGGYGDAIRNECVVATFSSKNQAEEFVKQFSNKHVYDIPYQELLCGELVVSEVHVMDSLDEITDEMKRSFWWIIGII